MSSTITKTALAGFFIFSICSCAENESQKPDVSPEVNVVVAGKENIPVYSEYVGQVYGLADVKIGRAHV